MKKLSRMTLSAQIVEEMERMIENEEWPVGSKIPSEIQLSQGFDVGRNTIREAISSLVQVGLLDTRRGGGSYVINNNRFSAAVKNELESKEISEIFEVRTILETAIINYACQRSTPEDLRIIESLFKERNESSGKTANELREIDKKFHFQIALASHNELLYQLYQSFFSFLEDLFALYVSISKDPLLIDIHEQLYLGILNRDCKSATQAINNLIETERKVLEEAQII